MSREKGLPFFGTFQSHPRYPDKNFNLIPYDIHSIPCVSDRFTEIALTFRIFCVFFLDFSPFFSFQEVSG